MNELEISNHFYTLIGEHTLEKLEKKWRITKKVPDLLIMIEFHNFNLFTLTIVTEGVCKTLAGIHGFTLEYILWTLQLSCELNVRK